MYASREYADWNTALGVVNDRMGALVRCAVDFHDGALHKRGLLDAVADFHEAVEALNDIYRDKPGMTNMMMDKYGQLPTRV